ncbi:unnamed protein product [Linum trigynum]|uniref:Uncharacterized protein n=1 Tax=Linum trigynum TaxID=586398 RepID=A0AAV2GIT4_9ROSI
MGSGRTISLENDPWIPGLPNFKIHPSDRQQLWAFQWIMDDGCEWNLDLIRQTCSIEEVEAIKRIPIGIDSADDEWVWHFEKSGIYTVKSGYHTFRESERNRLGTPNPNHPDCTSKAWKWLWSLSLPPKIISFIWRISRNAVATKRNLWLRRCSPSPLCSLCQLNEEDIWHCLFRCPHAARVWQVNHPSLPIPQDSTPVVMWLVAIFESLPNVSIHAVVVCLWAIWIARNERVFKGVIPRTAVTSANAVRDFNFWTTPPLVQSVHGTHSQHISDHSTLSLPPSSSQWEVYCDGSFRSESQVAAYGVIITNPHGQVVDGSAGTFFCSSAIVAEAKALLIAVRMAASLHGPASIFSDCKVLVDIIQDPQKVGPWQVRAWIQRIRFLLQTHIGLSLFFTPRSTNKSADWVAKEAANGSLPQ